MGVIFRKDRFEIRRMGQFWLSETPDVPASMSWGVTITRMVTWVRFLDKRTGKEFYFLDTHFAHRPQDEQARSNSAKVIADFLATLPKDIPVVLTGDFNTTPDKEAYKTITGYLQDAWVNAAERVGPEGTFHGSAEAKNRGPGLILIARLEGTADGDVTMHKGEKYPRTTTRCTISSN